MPADIAKLRREQIDDETNAIHWWRQTSNKDKSLLWDATQRMGASPTEELISRFAQIGMTHIALLAEKEQN